MTWRTVCAVLVLGIGSLGGCPQADTPSALDPPSCSLPAGVYTGNATARVRETDGGILVADDTLELPLTVIINNHGQVVSPLTGRVMRVGERIGAEIGVLEVGFTPSAITCGDATVVVAGTVDGSILGYAATGLFVFNYQSVSAEAIEFSGSYSLSTSDVLHDITVIYSGTVTK